jgi:putative aldouronate transport system permease protein
MPKTKSSISLFNIVNLFFMTSVTLICLIPILHIISLSLSENIYVISGQVTFWPKGFTLNAYRHLIKESQFWNALGISINRLAIGTALNMLLVIITAYPLSKEQRAFRARTVYAWFFAFTMFFGGGLIPLYIVVGLTKIMNTIWALILPGALNVWNTVLLLNFFREVPKELEEAAFIDGANHFQTLMKIYIPLSGSVLATILLFTMVGHWNSWFDGFIFLNSPKKYPLQTYLSTLVMQAKIDSSMRFITQEDLVKLRNISHKSLNIAQIFMGALPIMLVYPFLQRFFIKGIVIGSVKG